MRRSLHVIAFLALGFATVARADVDLTGHWVVEYDFSSFGGGVVTNDATLAQTGTSLTFTEPYLGAMTGTVDPTTGIFHVEGDPTPPPTVGYPEGPPPERNGHASLDSGRFDGTVRLWGAAPHFIWVPFDFPMIGARPELIVCGNAIRDPGEQCDDGALNGVDGCCDASCAFVDPNQVGPCGGDGSFVLTQTRLSANGKVPDTSRVAVKGMVTGPGVDTIGAVTSFRVDYETGGVFVGTFTCTRKNRVLTCDGANKQWQLKLSTSARGTKLGFKMKQAGLPRPLIGPVTVAFVDDQSIARTASAGVCTTTSTLLRCTP